MRGDYMSEVEFVFRDGPRRFVKVWKKVVLEPREFYREMPSTGGFENPLAFLARASLCLPASTFSKEWEITKGRYALAPMQGSP